jgi:hypothetical protein
MSSITNNSSSNTTNDGSFVGPTYEYYKYVKTPSDMGMNSKGASLTTDFVGLVEYVKLLVTGDSKASTTGKPLGNKFFLKTMANCKATDTGETVPRYVYFNNVPQGNVPFISQGLGVNFKDFKGIVPGTLSDLNNLNPANMYSALTEGSLPDCRPLTMQVIDVNNKTSTQTEYVSNTDISFIDPCSFQNKINPVTNQKCKETFKTLQNVSPLNDYETYDIPEYLSLFEMWKQPSYKYVHYTFTEHPIGYLFILGYCFIMLYLFYKLCYKVEIQ